LEPGSRSPGFAAITPQLRYKSSTRHRRFAATGRADHGHKRLALHSLKEFFDRGFTPKEKWSVFLSKVE
jgi:hypothetical protein